MPGFEALDWKTHSGNIETAWTMARVIERMTI